LLCEKEVVGGDPLGIFHPRLSLIHRKCFWKFLNATITMVDDEAGDFGRPLLKSDVVNTTEMFNRTSVLRVPGPSQGRQVLEILDRNDWDALGANGYQK
jgi:hypothetical protein